jgi:hypothetical protein
MEEDFIRGLVDGRIGFDKLGGKYRGRREILVVRERRVDWDGPRSTHTRAVVMVSWRMRHIYTRL